MRDILSVLLPFISCWPYVCALYNVHNISVAFCIQPIFCLLLDSIFVLSVC